MGGPRILEYNFAGLDTNKLFSKYDNYDKLELNGSEKKNIKTYIGRVWNLSDLVARKGLKEFCKKYSFEYDTPLWKKTEKKYTEYIFDRKEKIGNLKLEMKQIQSKDYNNGLSNLKAHVKDTTTKAIISLVVNSILVSVVAIFVISSIAVNFHLILAVGVPIGVSLLVPSIRKHLCKGVKKICGVDSLKEIPKEIVDSVVKFAAVHFIVPIRQIENYFIYQQAKKKYEEI